MDDSPIDATADDPSSGVVRPYPDPNFFPLVKRATFIAVVGWTVKMATMLRVNADLGGVPHVRKWGPGIPYLAFEIQRRGFKQITSTSTVVMGFVMLVLLVGGLLRNKGRLDVAGWCFAPISLGYAVGLDLLMDTWQGEYTDLSRLRWAFGVLSLSAVLVTWWIAVEHPHEALLRWREEGGAVGNISPTVK
jgi:hypothetical protein